MGVFNTSKKNGTEVAGNTYSHFLNSYLQELYFFFLNIINDEMDRVCKEIQGTPPKPIV